MVLAGMRLQHFQAALVWHHGVLAVQQLPRHRELFKYSVQDFKASS